MKKHILIVDDDQDEVYIFSEALKDMGLACKLTWERDVRLVVSQLTNIKPDIIFLDINMPLINGFQVLSAIRNIEAASDIPVIMYSNGLTIDDAEKAIRLGASGTLKKQNSIKLLVDELETILS